MNIQFFGTFSEMVEAVKSGDADFTIHDMAAELHEERAAKPPTIRPFMPGVDDETFFDDCEVIQ